MRVNFGVHLSACRQPGLSDTPDDPGMVLLYTISGLSTQYLSKKKDPPVGAGSRLYKGDKQKTTKTTKSISCSLRNCSFTTYHLSRVS
jgi:hypothetical protein